MAKPAVPVSLDLSRAGRLAVFAMLAFVALFLVASLASGGQEVLRRLTELAPQVIAVLCVLSLVNYLARALRWQVLGQKLGIATGWRLGGHSWSSTGTISIAAPIVTFFFFEIALNITLPKGYTEPLFYPLYDIFL